MITAAVVLAVAAVVCAMFGSEKVSLLQAFGSEGENNTAYKIFVNIRLPRIILAGLVGAALAASGVAFQALLRNPLADPYILGISSGAGLGAMIAIIGGISLSFLGGTPIGLFAFVGALATVWLVWMIGRITGRTNMTGLLLAGVVVNAFFSSMIMFLTSIAKSEDVFSTIFWLMGNLDGQNKPLWTSGGFIVAGIVGLYFISPQLNALSFSEDDARSMGINTIRVQAIAFAITALITAIAVSLSGLIGFVGLIVPHAIRLIFGPDHRQLVGLSAIYGGAFLIVADTIARVIVAPAQLPVGVVTALVGGPFFLILLVKFTRKAGV